MAQPGVIYCLRQKAGTASSTNERINPLAPHYLVYVHASGEVRLAFVQAKTVLNLFRSLALGKTEPYIELCRLFDRQTEQGSDMRAYTPPISSGSPTISKVVVLSCCRPRTSNLSPLILRSNLSPGWSC
jgi:hypothetical protein